jgi:hypothetical protein
MLELVEMLLAFAKEGEVAARAAALLLLVDLPRLAGWR